MVEEMELLQSDPVDMARNLLGLTTLWWGAEKIIQSIFQHKRVAVQSGHSLSKDWSGGIITLLWLLKYWDDAKVICTAPTGRQVTEIMFGEIEKQFSALRNNFPESFSSDQLITNKLTFGPQCFALGFTTKDTGNMIGKFQGFKSKNLLIIITEAQGISSLTYKQLRGLMTSSNSRIIELANPLVEFGDFYDHCTNPRYAYHVIKLSCFDSPNVIEKREVVPGLVTSEFVEQMRIDVGEEDPDWQSRVLGEFPQQSANAWIPLAKIKAAVNRTFPVDDTLKVGGLDVAREGADETVHCILEGRRQTKQDCFRKVLTPETVGWMRGLIEDEKLSGVAIDLGYNPGVYDWLEHESMPGLISVNFGGASPDEKYENLGTYMWWLLRQAFLEDRIGIVDDPLLVSQLSRRIVERTPRGKIKLQSKKKDGLPSPDRADALVLAWYARMCMMQGDHITAPEENSQAAQTEERIRHAVRQTRIKAEPSDEVSDIGEVESNAIEY